MDRKEQIVGVRERGEIVVSESFHASAEEQLPCRERPARSVATGPAGRRPALLGAKRRAPPAAGRPYSVSSLVTGSTPSHASAPMK